MYQDRSHLVGSDRRRLRLLNEPACRNCLASSAFERGEEANAGGCGLGTSIHLKRDQRLSDALLTSQKPFILAVTQGAIKGSKSMADGQRQILFFRFAGETLILSRQDYFDGLAVQAMTPTILCLVQPEKVRLSAEDKRGGERIIFSWVGEEMACAFDHMLRLGSLPAVGKVASFIIEIAVRTGTDVGSSWDVPLPMKRQDMAEYLALTAETVSRVLRKLEDRGVLGPRRTASIHVQDSTLLREIAGELNGG